MLIEGRLKLDRWEKDGQKHSKLSVVGERMQMLGSRGEGGGRRRRRRRPQRSAAATSNRNTTSPNNTCRPAARRPATKFRSKSRCQVV